MVDDLVPDGAGNHTAPSADCPVETALAAIAGKWTTLLLRELSRAELTFGGLKDTLPELSDKVLADRLATLVDRGVVDRVVHRGYPNRVAYSLIDAGRELRPLLIELYRTGTRLQSLRGGGGDAVSSQRP
ncbi:helix-turn-helix domain-containing protein [Tsukamurella sp. NPDC003166]|uniref:winged helix-turn-helix transcriptional regulator n=1 Tax=Tsukamurella sp. NPDC003166 TaxID=3154444 RepID=UPI0033BF7AD3